MNQPMAAIDAQEITFNQDPETGITDMGDDNKPRGCCCKVICCPCKVLYWYLAPLTCEICHTLTCFLFHPFNFAMGLFILTWDVTLISTGIGLIALCCMGIPLLWITFEIIVAFSRMDLGIYIVTFYIFISKLTRFIANKY